MSGIELREAAEVLKSVKVIEWKGKGYDEGLIQAGVNWAQSWAKKCGEKYGINSRNAEQIMWKMLPEGLELAENYILAMRK